MIKPHPKSNAQNITMTDQKLSDISKMMSKLDICMMSTIAFDGTIASRPMSNNGDVEYDGNSYFFSYDQSEVVNELKENDNINLTFTGKDQLYISITGKALLTTDKEILKEHWLEELAQWFKQGIETPGIILIHVKADQLKFWHKEKEGEVKL